jgi:hypothetical protein
MTIEPTFEIDQIAQRVFRQALPPIWLVREQHPDVHINYFVEIVELKKPTGLVFAVQLKGTSSLSSKKHTIRFPFKTEHINYYINNVRSPVFLIVVDTENRIAYWLFLQKYIKSNIRLSELQKRKKITLKIPKENLLEHTDEVLKSIKDAEVYMRDLWTSSIKAAVSSEKARLEALDKRFSINISYSSDNVTYQLNPKEDFDFKLTLNSDDPSILREKVSDLFDRGLDVKFQPGEIVIQGSPLFSHISEECNLKEVTLSASRRVAAEISLSAIAASKASKVNLHAIYGEFVCGNKEARFDDSNNRLPLRVSLHFLWDHAIRKQPFQFTFFLDTTVWEGRPVLQIGYFERLSTFLKSLSHGSVLDIQCEIKGNHVFTGSGGPFKDLEYLSRIGRLIDLIEKLRYIAQTTGANILFPPPDSFTKETIIQIELLHNLLKKGEHHQNASGLKASGVLSPSRDFFQVMRQRQAQAGSFTFEPYNPVLDLLGKEINLGYLSYTMTDARLLTELSDETLKQLERDGTEIELEWEGNKGSSLIISRMKTQ